VSRLSPRRSGKTWTPPRTADGQPDLQGVWSNSTLTPLERPAEFAGKEFLTEQEAADYVKRLLQQVNSDRRDGGAQWTSTAPTTNSGAIAETIWWRTGAPL
jgi:hypothetical protein